ncbi:hypothetical protein EDEG_03636 [Edhazardia aedis USNM 41457]|uniref:t-SNARE coiled-coil homology domain-containing protein n=1 Tax=Edhazardia aedis (strain USNM 41457) TaxID=1003232 RepID=J8ZQC2_EDHAE|nr:hypothetical protein EDEG_03636 [Edhazardia aedis USNM 41457]|eukprot:EJW01893.1 hypothetical protein EDEG_03636 [Edhazardia aedis USNM 41457]
MFFRLFIIHLHFLSATIENPLIYGQFIDNKNVFVLRVEEMNIKDQFEKIYDDLDKVITTINKVDDACEDRFFLALFNFDMKNLKISYEKISNYKKSLMQIFEKLKELKYLADRLNLQTSNILKISTGAKDSKNHNFNKFTQSEAESYQEGKLIITKEFYQQNREIFDLADIWAGKSTILQENITKIRSLVISELNFLKEMQTRFHSINIENLLYKFGDGDIVCGFFMIVGVFWLLYRIFFGFFV